MKHAKNIAIILVILVGLVSSYLILKNPDSQAVSSGANGEISKLNDEILSKNPIQWMEKVKDFISNPVGSSGLNEQADKNVSNDKASLNLTKLVAQSMSGQMQYLGQSGKDFDPNDPGNQEIIKKAMADAQNISLFDESISDKDLKILQDNSLEAKRFYLESMNKIAINSLNIFSINPIEALNKLIYGDASAINKVINYYVETYKNFLNTPVPSDWLDLHKRYLMVLKQMEVVYRGMADFQNDPVKASLLGDALPNMIKAEMGIREEYYNIEKEFGIK